MTVEALPFVRASELAICRPEQRWLIEELWAACGVGVIGGAPKSCKSWLGLEMAVSVASGTPCLGKFKPARRGRALLYMAEDADHTVRERLEALCRQRAVSLDAVDIFVITAPTLRIDLESEQRRLSATVAALTPDMLVLDPFVRLHRKDENSASEISAILAYLRELQRQFNTAVVLVHHARKNGSANQPGQALRGSSDIHAFGDSNLYLTRKADRLILSVEHRAAPCPAALELKLVTGDTPHLEVTDEGAAGDELVEAVRRLVITADGSVTRKYLRQQLHVRNERIGEAIEQLQSRGTIERADDGWSAGSSEGVPSVPTLGIAIGNASLPSVD